MQVRLAVAPLAFCVLGLVSCGEKTLAGPAADGTVTLKRLFKEGSVEKFTIETHNKQSMAGMGKLGPQNSDITMLADATETCSKVSSEGVATYTILTSNMRAANGEKLGAGLQGMLGKDVSVEADVDPRNMIRKTSEAKAPDAKPDPNGIGLPEKPVRPGDAWKLPFSQFAMFGAGGDLEYTYVGPTTLEGRPVYAIRAKGHFEVGKGPSSPTSKDPMAAVLAKAKGGFDVELEADLDQNDCSIARLVSKSKGKISAPAPGLEKPIQISLEVTTTKKRVRQ